MKITGGKAPDATASANRIAETAVADGSAAIAPAPKADAGALQSAALQPVLSELRDLPDFDHDKVAMLRDALAKGEVKFDPARLAGLIQRFHGGER